MSLVEILGTVRTLLFPSMFIWSFIDDFMVISLMPVKDSVFHNNCG
jgi:hypothetical protein